MDDLPAPPPRQPDPTLRGELERANRSRPCGCTVTEYRPLRDDFDMVVCPHLNDLPIPAEEPT